MTGEKLEMPQRRTRRYEISSDFFTFGYSTGMFFEVTKGFPPDVQFRGFVVDYERNVLVLFMEHESFDPVPESEMPPYGQIQFTRHQKVTTQATHFDEKDVN